MASSNLISTRELQLQVSGNSVPLQLVRNPRARRYIMRVRADRIARVTIPRGGSVQEALSFVERNRHWLETQLSRPPPAPLVASSWKPGSQIMFRGELTLLEADPIHAKNIRFGTQSLVVTDPSADLRPAVEAHLRRLATVELPVLVHEFARQHQLAVQRVTVRNQRSRWGSCSRRRTISLNWRLIQTPPFVRDYIILHELMHLREMNHSARYWRHVESVCPDYRQAEQWLKQHSRLLRL
jgi:predicted metal-dependent hydrolase